ncbi:MAG TPA: PorV/PorQ family protein, partial [Bacteroidota bacterium]|nr:PorV/PorQ family protein [Bacteroidota bacterium]
MTSHKMGKTISLFIISYIVIGGLLPKIVFGQGESAVPFLLIAPNARADGMGEAGAGLADDASAVHWNPAGLAFQVGQEISLTHSNWLPAFQQADLFYDFLTYRNHIDELGGTISASITYLNLGEFTITRDDPTPLGTFKAYETAITGGYATKLSADLGIGLNLRLIHSSLANINVQGQDRKGVATTMSFDIATLWRPSAFEQRFSVGLN